MKKALFIVVGVIALALLAFAAGVIFKKDKTVLPLAKTTEFHSKNGFTLTYPKDWVVDDSQKDAPAEFIMEPNGKAFFSIQTHMDPRITKSAEMPQVHIDIEQSFKNDPAYLVERLEWEKEDKTIAENSYFAAGSYTQKGTNWRFKELGIFTKNGTAFTLRGMTLKDYADTFDPMLDKIIFSVQFGGKKPEI